MQSVDELPKEGPASALMCLPDEADTTADCDGAKDIVAIIQAFKHDANASFSSRDCRVLYRLGEFAGNLLRNSRNLDRAHALYSQATISHKRSQALLDVAKVLSSEHRLDAIINIIVSQVLHRTGPDRTTAPDTWDWGLGTEIAGRGRSCGVRSFDYLPTDLVLMVCVCVCGVFRFPNC